MDSAARASAQISSFLLSNLDHLRQKLVLGHLKVIAQSKSGSDEYSSNATEMVSTSYFGIMTPGPFGPNNSIINQSEPSFKVPWAENDTPSLQLNDEVTEYSAVRTFFLLVRGAVEPIQDWAVQSDRYWVENCVVDPPLRADVC
ncbi:hypothetical protein N7451_004793 [Penicillium sp. IBT 35674x]|nr:hypothetical protein N7451_004793 [Penicillium sp. IBT 35674x]